MARAPRFIADLTHQVNEMSSTPQTVTVRTFYFAES